MVVKNMPKMELAKYCIIYKIYKYETGDGMSFGPPAGRKYLSFLTKGVLIAVAGHSLKK